MLRDKIRCPICKKEIKPYSNVEDKKQIFSLAPEDSSAGPPIRVFAYTCSSCGNIQMFGVI